MSVTYSLSWYKATTPTQGQAEQRKHIAKQLFSKGGLRNVENTDFFQKKESGLGAFCDIDSTQLPATLGGEKTYSELLMLFPVGQKRQLAAPHLSLDEDFVFSIVVVLALVKLRASRKRTASNMWVSLEINKQTKNPQSQPSGYQSILK